MTRARAAVLALAALVLSVLAVGLVLAHQSAGSEAPAPCTPLRAPSGGWQAMDCPDGLAWYHVTATGAP